MADQTNDPAPTRWFLRLPSGDTYYGRRYQGRTYELAPQGTIDLRLVDGQGVIAEGSLPTYPGRILKDSDTHSTLADHGQAELRYESSSGNLGGYVETYYAATVDGRTASVMRRPGEVFVGLDAEADGAGGVDRDWLADLLSFVATAQALAWISQINDKLNGPEGLPPVDTPIVTDLNARIRITLDPLPSSIP